MTLSPGLLEFRLTVAVSVPKFCTAKLALVSPDVIEAAISGESGLGLEVVGTSGDEAKVELVIKFDGVKGKASAKAAWGWVELTREFQLVQERELYRKEWLLTGDA